MSDNVTDVARRLGLKGPDAIKQVRRLIRRLVDRHDAAARLFLGPDGEIKPEARAWFVQLAADNYVNEGAWHPDPREHALREGQRRLALKIIRSAKLDAARLDALIEIEREVK